ncbi:MAG: hypothetical protein K5866_04400, partial [Treponema sp.]|nr:hypothetical protein [Treponema sp.]
KKDCQNYLEYLTNPKNLEKIQTNIFPLDIMNVRKFPENQDFKEKLEKESQDILNKIKGILND